MTSNCTKAYFTNSITLGFILIGSVALLNIVAGFASSIVSNGDAAYIAIRTLNYSTAPYVFFSGLGFVFYHSSKRSDFIVKMFNLGAVLLSVAWLFSVTLATTSSTLLSEVLETLYIQNLSLSVFVVATLSIVIIGSAWMNKKSIPVKR